VAEGRRGLTGRAGARTNTYKWDRERKRALAQATKVQPSVSSFVRHANQRQFLSVNLDYHYPQLWLKTIETTALTNKTKTISQPAFYTKLPFLMSLELMTVQVHRIIVKSSFALLFSVCPLKYMATVY
jgi:hypothetical protein